MRSFLIKLSLFILLPFIAYCIVFIYLVNNFKNDLDKHPAILLGDSHTEFVRNPGIFNISIHASPYFVHYKFAEEFIEFLNGKKIYISYNYHNFSNQYQNRLANDSLYPGWRKKMFGHLDDYHIFNYKYKELRPDDLDFSFFRIRRLNELFQKTILDIKTSNSSMTTESDTLSIMDIVNLHFHNKDYILEDSIQSVYLNKLIDLLKEHNCEVILLKMPVTNYYFDNVPVEIKNEMTTFAKSKNLRILDLNNELLISHQYKYFKDYGHLNIYGDTIVRNYFKTYELKGITSKN